MASKMCIYRCEFLNDHGENVRFFYARNAKVGKEFCRKEFAENGRKPERIKMKKIGIMTYDVGNPDAAKMDESEENKLILQNFGAGVKFAERNVMPAAEGD